jgi:hypothetical protein
MLTFDTLSNSFEIDTPADLDAHEIALLLDTTAHTIDSEIALKQGEN